MTNATTTLYHECMEEGFFDLAEAVNAGRSMKVKDTYDATVTLTADRGDIRCDFPWDGNADNSTIICRPADLHAILGYED